VSKKKKYTYGPCRFDCGREAVTKDAQCCGACYQALWDWQQRTPTAIFQRQKQLGVFERRMESLSNTRVLSTRVQRRKRA